MSTGLPPRSDIVNVNSLNYKQSYPEFDYNMYINEISLSNFGQGGGKKKPKNLEKILKQTYMQYIHGGASYLKQGGATQDFPIAIKDTYNTANLNYNTCYNPERPKHLATVPYSSFGL